MLPLGSCRPAWLEVVASCRSGMQLEAVQLEVVASCRSGELEVVQLEVALASLLCLPRF